MMVRRFSLGFGLALLVLATAAMAEEGTYRLGQDDVIRVKVWPRDDLSGEVVVDPNGNIQLPLVGRVAAEGATPVELGETLIERLKIMDPAISDVVVSVLEYRSRTVKVIGEVRAPGNYPFREIPGIWEVILGAGGANPTADLSKVQVVRKNPGGDASSITVDLSEGIEAVDPGSLPEILPKDTIILSSLDGDVATGKSFQVLGSVRTPGVYRLGSAESVIEALAISGGTTSDADLSQVRLTRPTANGVVSYQLDIKRHLYEGEPVSDLQLRGGDTITVPSRGGGLSFGSVFSKVLGFASIITATSGLIIALNN